MRKPIPIKQHIDEEFDGVVAAFCRSVNKHRNQGDSWIAQGVVWWDGNVYRKLTDFEEEPHKIVPLETYVDEGYKGSKRGFGAAIGRQRQQIQQWLRAECAWYNGNIYRRVTDFTSPRKKK